MAGTLASLTIRVGTDARDAVRGLSTLDRRVQQTKKKFTTLESSTLSLRSAFAVVAGATGAAFAAKKIFDLGSAVEETANKFNVVMGGAADDARQRLSELTDTIPMLQSEMEGMSAGIQDLLVPLGLVREDAADMSVDMVKLAGDLASFNNVAAEVPLEAIKSALAGMSRPLRQFGVDVSQGRLETLAMQEGLIGMGEELDSAARAQAVMIAVQRDSSDAMGDAARTADSAANTMRFFMRDVRQVAETFSVALVPAIKEFVGEGSSGLQFLETFAAEMQNQAPVIAAWARFAVEAGKFAALAFAAPLRIAFNLGQAIGDLAIAFDALSRGEFAEARDAGASMVSQFGDMKDVVTGLIDSFDGMRTASGEAFGVMPEQIRTATAAARDFAGALTGGGGESGGGGGTGLIPAIQQVGNELRMAFVMPLQDLVNMDQQIQATAESAGEISSEAEAFRSSFASAASQAGLDFKEFASIVISELKRIAIQKAALAIFDFLGLGGMFGKGGFFAGFKQHGGFVPRGQFAIAGEAGPEIVTGPARITSTEQTSRMMSGSRSSITDSFARVMDRLGPPPGPIDPNVLAQSDYHRRLISEALQDFTSRGGSI